MISNLLTCSVFCRSYFSLTFNPINEQCQKMIEMERAVAVGVGPNFQGNENRWHEYRVIQNFCALSTNI